MSDRASRRTFLTTGLALPASALTMTAAPAAPKLEHRQLGKTGLKVTTVGFGCMVTSDASVIARAVDLGVNFFDTARVYQSGNNERMVGAALKGKRQGIILCSKSLGKTKERALADLDISLKELQTDYLDVWYLHSKKTPEDITDELLEAQRVARQQGKIRFAGISTHVGHRELIPAVVKCGKFDVLLVSYNFTMGKTIDDLLESTRAAGIGVVGMKVMAGGYRPISAVPNDPKVIERLHQEGAFPAALKWVIRNRNVDTTIPSIVDMDQLDENARVMGSAFGAGDEKLLLSKLDFLTPRYCRMCNGCDGACPKGLPVSDVLRYLTYAEGYGQFALGRENFL
ncbi:MAG: aldo/keto reductase, partial [Acidobacteria bacterium]|nr:aldo/keto reductase [Acidobacteriota bacterium]